MKKSDILVVAACILFVSGIAGAKIYKQQSSIGSEKPYVLEICTPSFCYDQTFYNVKKHQILTDNKGRKFMRVYFNDKSITDVDLDGKTVKVK